VTMIYFVTFGVFMHD